MEGVDADQLATHGGSGRRAVWAASVQENEEGADGNAQHPLAREILKRRNVGGNAAARSETAQVQPGRLVAGGAAGLGQRQSQKN